MAGKIAKGVLFAIGGMALVLFTAFIYINNDLDLSSLKKTVDREVVSKLPVVPGKTSETTPVKVDESDVTVAGNDAQLDAVFTQDEPADNFDNLVD